MKKDKAIIYDWINNYIILMSYLSFTGLFSSINKFRFSYSFQINFQA